MGVGGGWPIIDKLSCFFSASKMIQDGNHLQAVGGPRKLKWVTPKISLLETSDVHGTAKTTGNKTEQAVGGGFYKGPS